MKRDDQIRRFIAPEGWEILVGRSARANDRLSLRLGHPSDFWFHIAGMPGSHVVARHPDRPPQINRDVKRIAAGLAAFYSKARHAGNVSVHWTQCRNLGKQRGAPAGQVTLKRFDSISTKPIDPHTCPLIGEPT